MRDSNSSATTAINAAERIDLARNVSRALLIHPPIYDIRIPWVRFVQPIRLLRLSTYFRSLGTDVQFIDAVALGDDKPLRKVLARTLKVDDHSVNVWRFGMSPAALEKALRALKRDQWQPDVIYVECATTFWWEGAKEVIATAKTTFPESRICLIGAYAELAQEHARSQTQADAVGTLDWSELARLTPNLSHYRTKPDCIYMSLDHGKRPAAEVVDEMRRLRTDYNVQSFAFLDHAITTDDRDSYCAVLEHIIAEGIRVRLSALGTIPVRDFANNPELATLMKQAGYAQICFADDRGAPIGADADKMLIENAARAAGVCERAGFRIRTDAVTGSLCLGRPGESLEARGQTATKLAHYLGSLIFWPYQPSPTELPKIPLEDQNGKLFPFRNRDRSSFTDYLSILGLASVLNAKYRTETFDFMGNGLISRLFRESIGRKAWDPPEEIKGTLKLPVVKR